ncbi:MAG: Bacterial polymerase, alpha chain terminal domain [Candidatus Saccharibacteria bacterium]|nr:Bacterial polymerase, alpha chain terminal domain [Candidatus Saccharibacteria bacterium]
MMKGTTMADDADEVIPQFLAENGWSDLYVLWQEAPHSVHQQMKRPLQRYLEQKAKAAQGFDPTGITVRDELVNLDLATRTQNGLQRNGIYLVGDIILFTQSELRKMPNIGDTAMGSIQERIEQMGLEFGESSESEPERLQRVYGSTLSAPALSLVALAPLREKDSIITFSGYRRFVISTHASTVEDVFSLTESEKIEFASQIPIPHQITLVKILSDQQRSLQ